MPNHDVNLQESGSFSTSRKALLCWCLCLCWAFKWLSLIWRGIYRKSLNPSLSQLIALVCVWPCVCLFVSWEGARCHKMQQITSGQARQRQEQGRQTQHRKLQHKHSAFCTNKIRRLRLPSPRTFAAMHTLIQVGGHLEWGRALKKVCDFAKASFLLKFQPASVV